MIKKRPRRRALAKSIIAATMIEGLLLGWCLYEVQLGGIEGGGRMFAALHVPSSTIFGIMLSALFDTSASIAIQVIFAVFVTLSQVFIFTVFLLWISEFISRTRHKQ